MKRALGIFARAVAVLLGLAGAAWTAPNSPPNVLLITLDTTRRDRLGLYGYERDTSPELDRLAANSVVYTQAYGVTSWTLPAHASLFTGKFPASHGAEMASDGAVALSAAISGPASLAYYRANGLATSEPTLAEILRGAGYATGAVVAGPWMKRLFGLDRGFDFYDDAEISTMKGRIAKQVNKAALPWIAQHADERFFLFLNYFDPHTPYADPEDLARLFVPENMVIAPPLANPKAVFYDSAYDGEIRYMDRHIGLLLMRLRELGLYDRTLIVVAGDHGELIGEHGKYGHGFTLYEEELRIPLIVKYPAGERAPARVDDRLQLTDVMPLLLERLGLPLPESLESEIASGAKRPVFAEVRRIAEPSWRVWLRGDYKYVWNTQNERSLYDLSTDPGESKNLASDEPVRVRRMEEELEAFRARLPAPPPPSRPVKVDPETQRALENLGYLD